MSTEAKIIDIQIQPLKGGGSLGIPEARMTTAGLETVDGQIKDHGLVVVTGQVGEQGFHHFLTQRVRVSPKDNLYVPGTGDLALAVPQYENGKLAFVFNGQSEVLDPGEENDDLTRIRPVQVWEYWGAGLEVPVLSEFMSDNLHREVKVMRTSGPWNRMSRQNFMENTNPARAYDGYPVHAVEWGDAEAVFKGIGAETDPSRFRYQVLLNGLGFREIHGYEGGKVNGVGFKQPKPCDRCEVTGRDQETGEFSPIKPLAGFSAIGAGRWIRPDNNKRVHVMGENWLPLGETVIGIGDIVKFTTGRVREIQFEELKPKS